MSHDTLKATLLQLALPAVRAQGLDIWGLELIEGRQMIVRLFVEAATGNTETDMMNGAEGGSEEAAPSREQLSATVDQCEAISRQFSLALDAEDVIDRAYTLEVSTPGFNRIFFSAGQMSAYVGDLIEARIEKAKTLLTNEALQIQHVAEMCGFSNISHFTRYFKKQCGCTPREYGSQSHTT